MKRQLHSQVDARWKGEAPAEQGLFIHARLGRSLALPILLLNMLLGCQSNSSKWDGPSAEAQTSVKPWRGPTSAGRSIRTAHYLIHTTVTNDSFNARIGQLVIAPVVQAVWAEVDSLDETARGAGGFGSTGR